MCTTFIAIPSCLMHHKCIQLSLLYLLVLCTITVCNFHCYTFLFCCKFDWILIVEFAPQKQLWVVDFINSSVQFNLLLYLIKLVDNTVTLPQKYSNQPGCVKIISCRTHSILSYAPYVGNIVFNPYAVEAFDAKHNWKFMSRCLVTR